MAWTGYAVAILVGAALLIGSPRLRPSYRDAFPFSTHLLNILTISGCAMLRVCVHEGAHVVAAAAHGLRSRLSVSRRLYFLTFQADLTRLWSLPRRARYGPLLAGMTWDATVMAAALGVEATLAAQLDPIVMRLIRAVVLLQFTGLVLQMLIFMRTDVYALLVNATGMSDPVGHPGRAAAPVPAPGEPGRRAASGRHRRPGTGLGQAVPVPVRPGRGAGAGLPGVLRGSGPVQRP